jgi:hypothetical protein
MLTLGKVDYLSHQLVNNWQELTEDARCNFCAIEVGDAPESDRGLVDLLHTHVPQGAAVYIVQRDSNVSSKEVKQVQQVLDDLDIPLASDGTSPLVADDQSAWTFQPRILDTSSNPAFNAQRPPSFEQAAPSAEAALGPDASSIWEELEVVRRMRHELRIADFNSCLELNKIGVFIDSLGAQLTQDQIGEGFDLTDSGPAMPQILIHFFNELQFTTHWQASASTPEAKVLRHLLAMVYRMDEDTQSHVAFPLLILLCHMRHDPALCRSVLGAASELSINQDGVMAISKLCMACMEQRVASGAVDDEPLVALDFARCVQRSRLLGEIYLRERGAMHDSAELHPRLRAEICCAFDQALMSVALHGGQEEVSFSEAADPIAVTTVQSAWREMKQLGNETFNDFLRDWAPWQALMARRQTEQAKKRKLQSSMKD